MPLLEVKQLSKTFHIHHLQRTIPVFNDITFTLSEGQFLLVNGSNGAGKSTLLRCLFRTYMATGGQALYHSQHGLIDLATAADVDIMVLRQQEIGFVTQFLRARPRVSAVDLVAEPLLLTGLSSAEATEQAEAMLAHFGLKRELWSAYPTTFSGGEQQKMNLARALITPRRLLLLDEPTASLDVNARASLVEQLRQLKARGVAFIGIFHYVDEIKSLVDDTIALSEGLPLM